MENKQFPEQNGENAEEVLVMPELDMQIDISDEEATPAEEIEEMEIMAEDAPSLEATIEAVPVAEDIPQEIEEEIFVEAAEEAIEEPVAESLEHDLLHTPVWGDEIIADEHAMSAHDLYHPNDPEPEFLTYNPESGFNAYEPAYDEDFREINDEEGEFQTMFQAEPAARSITIEDAKPRPPRKGRPKRKKGYGLFGIPHLIATAIWLVITVAIGVSLGRMLWVCAADVLAFGREDKAVTVTISTNDTIEDIAQKLHEAELIRYPGLFQLYASIAVDEGEIATGTFTLNTIYDYHAIVNGMSAYSSFRNVVEDVLIPEGYNCRQIFELLEENGICTVEELEEYAANGEFSDFWFLEGIERGDKYCLEGYLFPDTYDFYAGSTPREALGKMLLGFEARFTEDLRNMLPTLNERLSAMMRANGCSEDFVAANQIGMKQLVIVASLIEEETSSAAESKNIASVIYNRYTQDQAYERYLGIDATILYALGEHKEELTAEDLAIDSPYNTRINAGLTPTPITNPGLDSLRAALDFADTDYYYYVLNPSTGHHQFSETLAEHEAWRQEFGG